MDLFRDVRVEKDLETAFGKSRREGKWSSVPEVNRQSDTFVDLKSLRTLVKNHMAEEKRIKGRRVKLFRPVTGLVARSESISVGGIGAGGGGDDYGLPVGGQGDPQWPPKPQWPPQGDGLPKRGGSREGTTKKVIGTGIGMAILGAEGGSGSSSIPVVQ